MRNAPGTLDAAFDSFRSRVIALGLPTQRAYAYYAIYAALSLSGIVFSYYFLTVTTNIFLQLANAVLLAFFSVQAGMLGHDLSHGQVFRSKGMNLFFGIVVWGLVGGLSEAKWFAQHNAHHKYPNQLNKDPDLMEIPFVFSELQVPHASAFMKRYLIPFQHILFFLMLPLLYLHGVLNVFIYAVQYPTWRTIPEMFLIVIHFSIFFYFIFAFLPLLTACMFFVVNMFCVGVYMSLLFAPNHKGEEVVPEGARHTWFNQITSTRNVTPSLLTFQLLGGLNFQIEHHLFPSMARPVYWKLRSLVQNFCAEHKITYYEVSWPASLVEIYRALKKQSDLFAARKGIGLHL